MESWSTGPHQTFTSSNPDKDHLTLPISPFNSIAIVTNVIIITFPNLNFIIQANCGPRQPLPKFCVNEAAGAGDSSLHCETRDAACSRILSLTLCIL